MAASDAQAQVDALVALKALRDELDAEYERLRDAYTERTLSEAPGSKGDWSALGDVQRVFARPTPDEERVEFAVTDGAALMADPSDDFAEWIASTWLPANMARAAEEYFHDVGEVLDGCEVRTEHVPGQPRRFRYVKVVPNARAREAARAWLDGALPQLGGGSPLLGGGADA